MKEERAILEKRRKDREEQHLYLPVWVVTEGNFKSHQGFDLTSWDLENDDPAKPHLHRVLKVSTVAELTKKVADSQNIPSDHVRLWVMVNRQNKTVRPDQPLEDGNMTIETAYVKHGARDRHFRLWAEVATAFEDGKPLWTEPPSATKSDPPILIFLKHFDAESQTLRGVGHIYLKKQAKVSDMFPMIMQKMSWGGGSTGMANGIINGNIPAPTLSLYEEIKSSMIEPMKPKATLQNAEIQDGDIVCFQRQLAEKQVGMLASTGNYTDAREFYDYLLNRKTVIFSPKLLTDDHEGVFKLDLSRKMSYEQFSAKVGEYLKVEPTHLRFSTVNSTTGKAKAPVRRNAAQTLNQILSPAFGTYGGGNQREDSLYYEILDMSLSELDTKKSLKVTYLTDGQVKEETFDLLVPKLGNVADLFAILAKKANIDHEISSKLRIYETNNAKIYREYRNESPISSLSEYSNLIVEAIPEEEQRREEENTVVISCYHYDKDPNKPHGIPFRFVIQQVGLRPQHGLFVGDERLTRCRVRYSKTPKNAFQ